MIDNNQKLIEQLKKLNQSKIVPKNNRLKSNLKKRLANLYESNEELIRSSYNKHNSNKKIHTHQKSKNLNFFSKFIKLNLTGSLALLLFLFCTTTTLASYIAVPEVRENIKNITSLNPSGILAIQSDPEKAIVYIDDKKMGETPFIKTISQGNHKIKLEKQGYETIKKDIFIDDNKRVDLQLQLRLIKPNLFSNFDNYESLLLGFNLKYPQNYQINEEFINNYQNYKLILKNKEKNDLIDSKTTLTNNLKIYNSEFSIKNKNNPIIKIQIPNNQIILSEQKNNNKYFINIFSDKALLDDTFAETQILDISKNNQRDILKKTINLLITENKINDLTITFEPGNNLSQKIITNINIKKNNSLDYINEQIFNNILTQYSYNYEIFNDFSNEKSINKFAGIDYENNHETFNKLFNLNNSIYKISNHDLNLSYEQEKSIEKIFPGFEIITSNKNNNLFLIKDNLSNRLGLYDLTNNKIIKLNNDKTGNLVVFSDDFHFIAYNLQNNKNTIKIINMQNGITSEIQNDQNKGNITDISIDDQNIIYIALQNNNQINQIIRKSIDEIEKQSNTFEQFSISKPINNIKFIDIANENQLYIIYKNNNTSNLAKARLDIETEKFIIEKDIIETDIEKTHILINDFIYIKNTSQYIDLNIKEKLNIQNSYIYIGNIDSNTLILSSKSHNKKFFYNLKINLLSNQIKF